MAREVHEDTATYTIEWDDDIEAVVHTWNSFSSGQQFRDGCEALLDAIKHYGASRMLVDTREIQAHDKDDQMWLQTEWTPRTIEAGIEATAMVHRDSVISEMELENMMDDMDNVPQEAKVTSDMDEARDWLAEQ
jgi:hypothetical protein